MTGLRAFPGLYAAALVAAVLLSGCGVRDTPPPMLPIADAPLQPVETIPIRLSTSWPALLALAEAAIPICRTLAEDGATCADPTDGMILEQDEWFDLGRNWLGRPLGAKGSAWREAPLDTALAEDQLTITLGALYRVRVGTMDGRRELASCGFDEPPREIRASLAGRLRLAAEWYLDPSLTAAVDPANDCTASMLKVNLSDRFAEPLRAKLQEEADDVAARVRQVTLFREKAAALWAKASEPIDIGRDTWLEFNPVGVVSGPIRLIDDGQSLSIPMALKARPRVVLGARPGTGEGMPLPPVTPGDVTPQFDVNVRGLVTYEQASRKLTEKLGGRRLSAFIFEVEVESVTVSGSGNKVVLAVEIRGSFNGTLYLYGTPQFLAAIGQRAGGELTFEDIDYALASRSIIARIGQALFSDRIRDALAENAQWDLTGELQSALGNVTRAINRELTPDATISGRFTSFGPGTVRVGPEGVEGWYRVGGQVEIVFDPF